MASAAMTAAMDRAVASARLDPELLFQIITEREERASVAIATNLPFGKSALVRVNMCLVAPKFHGFGCRSVG